MTEFYPTHLQPISPRIEPGFVGCYYGAGGEAYIWIVINNNGTTIFRRELDVDLRFEPDYPVEDQIVCATKWAIRAENLHIGITMDQAADMLLSSDNQAEACMILLRRVVAALTGKPLSVQRGSIKELREIGSAISRIIGRSFRFIALTERTEDAIEVNLKEQSDPLRQTQVLPTVSSHLCRYFLPVASMIETRAADTYEYGQLIPFGDLFGGESSHDALKSVNVVHAFYDARILEGFFTEEDKTSAFAELCI